MPRGVEPAVTREEIDLAVRIIDQHMVEVVAPADTQAAWRALRAELRRTRKVSERVVPSIATAAQHVALAVSHAQKSLDALGNVTTGAPDSVPPPPPEKP